MIYRCGHCGFKGHCYGAPTDKGVTAPWCTNCQLNDRLTLMKKYRVKFWVANVEKPKTVDVDAEDEMDALIDATTGYHDTWIHHEIEEIK